MQMRVVKMKRRTSKAKCAKAQQRMATTSGLRKKKRKNGKTLVMVAAGKAREVALALVALEVALEALREAVSKDKAIKSAKRVATKRR